MAKSDEAHKLAHKLAWPWWAPWALLLVIASSALTVFATLNDIL